MQSPRGDHDASELTSFGAARVASAVGMTLGVVVYLLVAPFRCHADPMWGGRRVCEGLVAFHYNPDSPGHWQAIGAAAVVGGIAALLLWLVIAPEGRARGVMRAVATPLLVAFTLISLVSQSVLLVLGPVIGGGTLWLMWQTRARRPGPKFEEPGPFYGRH